MQPSGPLSKPPKNNFHEDEIFQEITCSCLSTEEYYFKLIRWIGFLTKKKTILPEMAAIFPYTWHCIDTLEVTSLNHVQPYSKKILFT